MIPDTFEKEFRIPKVVAPVVCHTTTGETISGEVFLDVIGKCTPKHLQELFDGETAFFPIRLQQSQRPLLLSKNMIVLVELVLPADQLKQDSSVVLSERKKALFDVHTLGSIDCEILIDSPVDRSRVLDVLNDSKRFVAVIWNETFSLMNISHIFRIVEL